MHVLPLGDLGNALVDHSNQPIFILGCGRSGTTLLRLMLNRHPHIAIPGETWYFPDIDRIRAELAPLPEQAWRETVLEFIAKSATFPELGVTQDQVARELEQVARSDWGAVLAVANIAFSRNERKSRWGDKTPGYVRHLPLLAREFPNAFIIHMIRDARDVAASFFEQPFGPKEPIEAGAYWKRDVMLGRSEGPKYFRDRYLEVRYEELAVAPERVLRRVLQHIGEDYDPVVLDQQVGVGEYIVRDHHWHNLATKPVTTSRVGRWRDTLSPREVQLVELAAGRLLGDLGYGTNGPKSLGALSAWALHSGSQAWRRRILGLKVALHRALKARNSSVR